MKRNNFGKLFIIAIIMFFLFPLSCSFLPGSVKKDKESDKTVLQSSVEFPSDVLAAMIFEKGGWSEMTFLPVQILSFPSERTKEQYEVISLCGHSDIARGQKHWTSNVILKSHLVKENEIRENMVVLAKFDNSWIKAVVLDKSNLYKRVVKIGLFYNFDDSKPYNVKNVSLNNIFISDKPDLGYKL